jgi:disulfide bond formation protein DsbB
MPVLPSRRQANLAGFTSCVLMMGFALYEQYGAGLQPCNMCVLQRVAVIALGVVFLAAALHNPGPAGARFYAALLGLVAAAGAATAGRHVWMQMQPPGSLSSCGADLGVMLEMMPLHAVVTKVLTGGAECQQITWSLLGLSMPGWVLVALLALALYAIGVNLWLPSIQPNRRSRTRA